MINQITCQDNVRYYVEDYPYGFRLRTTIRYWIETRPGYGQRSASQTRNPKMPGEVWNNPKYSTYSAIIIMYLEYDEKIQKEIVKFWHLSDTSNQTELDKFKVQNFILSDYQEKQLLIIQARINAGKYIKYTINEGQQVQTLEEQASIIRNVVINEYLKLVENK